MTENNDTHRVLMHAKDMGIHSREHQVSDEQIAHSIVENWDDLADLESRIALAITEARTNQRESDACLVENYHECPSTNDYNIAQAIRANTGDIKSTAACEQATGA